MSKLKVTTENAQAAWNGGDAETRRALENLFPTMQFTPPNIMDIVKSYEDACRVNGTDPIANLRYLNPKNKREESRNARDMAEEIVIALNGDWVADFSDSAQTKWWPYLKWDNAVSAFRLWSTNYDITDTTAGAGVRPFALKSEPLAKYFATQFIDILNKI